MKKNTALLTAKIDRETHKRVHQIAKSNGIPVGTFARLVWQKTVEDYERGEFKITHAELTTPESK